jgi:signal transduction histidine kinase
MSDTVETMDRLRLRLRELEQQCSLLRAERDQLRANLQAAQQRELEDRARHAQTQDSLTVLAGGVAHEFNNLLTSIMGYTSLSLGETTSDEPAHDYLRQVLASSQRAAELCQQILAYAGQARFHLQPLDLNALLRQMLPAIRTVIEPSAVLVVDLAPDLPIVEADPSQMRQVLLSLLHNALEALPEGRGRVNLATRTLVDPGDLPPGRYILLEITDTGIGMDAETLRRAFEPFFTTKFTGRGLGLAAVQGIVRAHHGGVQVTSKPGQGTSFRVLLPHSILDQASRTEVNR